MKSILPFMVLIICAGFFSSCLTGGPETGDCSADSLELNRVAYNHPGLEVELGVGLWAWPLPMDYDADGDMDLLVSCNDVPFNGLYFFENSSGPRDALSLFEPPVRIGPGRKNLQVSYIDGEARILENGHEYMDFVKSLFDQPREVYPAGSLEKEHEKVRFSLWKMVDYENDGDLDLLASLDDWGEYGWDNAFDSSGRWTNGPLHGYVYWLENDHGEYSNRGRIPAGGEDLDVYGFPSTNMDDFDGDGDLDIICGEFLDGLTWFENTGSREVPVFEAGRKLENEKGLIRMHVEMIVPMGVDWDKDGDVDLVVGEEDGRVAWLENTGRVRDHMPLFREPVYFRQIARDVKFGALVTPFSVDWDDDGDDDLICGNTAGNIAFIENLGLVDPVTGPEQGSVAGPVAALVADQAGDQKTGQEAGTGRAPRWNPPVLLEAGGQPIRIMAGENGSIQGPAEAKWGYTTLSVADWNHDGLKDIVVNSIWGKVVWYENKGDKGQPVLDAAKPVWVAGDEPMPKPAWNWWDPEPGHLVTQWRTTPYALDWNGDGLTDLIMLDQEGYLSYFERTVQEGKLRLAPGRRIFHVEGASGYNSRHNITHEDAGILRLNTQLYGGSGRRKICFVDWDCDGDLDLLVNSLNVSLLENTGEGDGMVVLVDRGPLSGLKLAGHTTSPTVVDWNKNGIPDLLVGAEDGHLYYAGR